ncbi:WSC domain-containing protein [Cavenderia fasciculata]|uniref:WSC domain-containing protein n=1 Tax=Cavenderia fasciculata TaxID=261658 RepID=F4PY41_CACFS|nr:WSC domain-containing protein [Cavenderia fasciculata]EGG19701.1 WSC domain-containing protein [Cavenderia fasciculata]|eukprot:XP_004357995.1 WSC domain-containing protein [Cavenderia fasciculata]
MRYFRTSPKNVIKVFFVYKSTHRYIIHRGRREETTEKQREMSSNNNNHLYKDKAKEASFNSNSWKHYIDIYERAAERLLQLSVPTIEDLTKNTSYSAETIRIAFYSAFHTVLEETTNTRPIQQPIQQLQKQQPQSRKAQSRQLYKPSIEWDDSGCSNNSNNNLQTTTTEEKIYINDDWLAYFTSLVKHRSKNESVFRIKSFKPKASTNNNNNNNSPAKGAKLNLNNNKLKSNQFSDNLFNSKSPTKNDYRNGYFLDDLQVGNDDDENDSTTILRYRYEKDFVLQKDGAAHIITLSPDYGIPFHFQETIVTASSSSAPPETNGNPTKKKHKTSDNNNSSNNNGGKENGWCSLIFHSVLYLQFIVGVYSYGEPSVDGAPSWFERSNLMLINAVRIAPKEYLKKYTNFGDHDILSPDVYPAVPPVFWEPTLGKSSRYHSQDMATNQCFSHPSCDGTDTFDRIGRYYKCSSLATENIAAGMASPLETNNQWICDSGSGDPYSTSCAGDGGADGHRKNIMSPDSLVVGVGYGYSAQGYRFFWTQDFGNSLCVAALKMFPVHSGSHIFDGTNTIDFMADWYPSTLISRMMNNQVDASVVIVGKKYPMSLDMGTTDKGKCVSSFSYAGHEYAPDKPTTSTTTGSVSTTGRATTTDAASTTTQEGTTTYVSTTTSQSTTGWSSTTTDSASTTTSSISTTTTTGTPDVDPTPTPSSSTDHMDGESYVGCYVDQVAHDLSESIIYDDRLTNGRCISHCARNLYKYAGSEYGNICYCGNKYGYYGKADNASECHVPCKGNTSEVCGGDSRLSIYESGFVGCYDFKKTVHQFTTAFRSSQITANGCRSLCKSKSFDVSATTHGNLCLCAHSFELDQSALIIDDPDQCRIKCTYSNQYPNQYDSHTNSTTSSYDFCGTDSSTLIYNNKDYKVYMNDSSSHQSFDDYVEDEAIFNASSFLQPTFSLFFFFFIFIFYKISLYFLNQLIDRRMSSSPKITTMVGGSGSGSGAGNNSNSSSNSGKGSGIPSNFLSHSAASNLPKFKIGGDDDDDDHRDISHKQQQQQHINSVGGSSSNSAYSLGGSGSVGTTSSSLNNSSSGNNINHANGLGDSPSSGGHGIIGGGGGGGNGGRTRVYEDYNDILGQTASSSDYTNHKDRHCSTYANRVLFSNKYYYAYIFMIFINLVLIIWLIVNLVQKSTSVPTHWLFVLLDILVNVSLFIEISLQIISQKRRYFNSWSNIFDCVVLVFSIAGLFMYLFTKKDHQFDFEGIIIIFFTALRYVVQFLRLLAMIKRQKLKSSTFNSRVDFTELKDTDLVFDVDSSDF